MPSDTPAQTLPAPPLGEEFARFTRWCTARPLEVALVAACLGTLVYFFAFFKIFTNGELTTLQWAMTAWNPENNQEHSFAVLPITLFLFWYHRRALRAAPKAGSNAGLGWVAAGLAVFVLGVRCLQPRFALCALPLLVYGGIRYVWGREVGRLCIFPCLFLLFMVPVGGFVQGTVSLQLVVSAAVKALAALIGVKIEMIGTTLRALDGSFNFEIAEGCSGIRSLMAMTMLAALYVHFTQREAWKQWVIFGGSVVFALIGNIGRIFTVILFARFISPEIAGGIYHDWSGFIFFPFAVLAMTSFSKLLNTGWKRAAAGPPAQKSSGPISYDY